MIAIIFFFSFPFFLYGMPFFRDSYRNRISSENHTRNIILSIFVCLSQIFGCFNITQTKINFNRIRSSNTLCEWTLTLAFHRSAAQEKSIRPILNVENLFYSFALTALCFFLWGKKAKQHVFKQQSEGDTHIHHTILSIYVHFNTKYCLTIQCDINYKPIF